MEIKYKNIIALSAITIIAVYLSSQLAFAQSVYTSEELFAIPWSQTHGVPGELSIYWNFSLYEYTGELCPPGNWEVNKFDELVIFDAQPSSSLLMKFSSDGSLTTYTDLDNEQGFRWRNTKIGFLDSGEVLIGDNTSLILLGASLNIIQHINIDDNNGTIDQIVSTDHQSFYVLYSIGEWDSYESVVASSINFKYVDVDLYGNMSAPVELYNGPLLDYVATLTPMGTLVEERQDKYMSKYIESGSWGIDEMFKYSMDNELIYQLNIQSEPDWEYFNFSCGGSFFNVMWSGDFYTLHATESGAVLTKYDLHVDPVCNLMVVTPRPHTGPSPVAIEFDASGTYDDDGDTLTFHWDFDGDKVFDEPVDDAYTGTPSNPTHEYTADFEGPVNLRVTDNYQGECDTAVILSVDVQ